MLPYIDTEAVKLWVEFQSKIYKELNKVKTGYHLPTSHSSNVLLKTIF
jgi:hypothetical protein